MGLLKSVIGQAVRDGVRKGVTEAVGKAAEKVLAPKAEAAANVAASKLDEVTGALNEANNEVKKEETKSAFANLENSLKNFAESQERLINELEKNVKDSDVELSEEANKYAKEFPVWTFPAKGIRAVENDVDGDKFVSFYVDGGNATQLNAYLSILKANGFVQKYPNSDEVLVKNKDGKVFECNTVGAFEQDELEIVFVIRK